MTLLVSGVLLFAVVHFIPTFMSGLKAGLLRRLGEGGYKGIFSLLLLLAFGLIIAGWRNTTPVLVYPPPPALHPFALGLLALAFLLLVLTARPSRLRRLIRHPQLSGVALWGVSHLLLNGDNRSLVLFGGIALWAIIEIVAINRREGVWIKPDVPSWGAEGLTLLMAAITVAIVVAIHPWLSGVAVW
jgi:uncharacterized membrane protein